MENNITLNFIRWSARIIGALTALFCLLFFVGYIMEGLNKPEPKSGPEFYNVILFAVWGIGLFGFLLGWKKELLGGIVSLFSFVVFNIMAALNPVEGSSYSLVLLIFFIPSLLFLLYSFLEKRVG